MSFPFSVDAIVRATGCQKQAVSIAWPLIANALKSSSVVAIQPVVAVLATVATEDKFTPIEEQGDATYFHKMYANRADYEVDEKGLWKWRGRGYVQLSTKANYAKYSEVAGVDLLAHPEAALQPGIAAKVLVAFMFDHGCFTWASRGHWDKVRTQVNGGHNGEQRFLQCVWNLLTEAYN